MAAKKKKADDLVQRVDAIKAALPTVDPELLDKARTIFRNTHDQMQALMAAASENWRPALEPNQIDETIPYLSDEEFDDVANVTELMAEMSTLRAFALFLGVPEHIIDPVVQGRLANKLIPNSPTRNKPPFFVVKKQDKK